MAQMNHLFTFSNKIQEARVAADLARSVAPGILVEVSGGITIATAPAYAAAGVDLISLGSLTHSVRNLDLGLDLTRESV